MERRHEMTQLMLARRPSERRLYLFFSDAAGELRRNEIAEDFPLDPPPRLLESVWRNAEVIRAAVPGEMQSRVELTMPRMRDVAIYTWRAVRLRCPNCGRARAVRSWFKFRDRCPVCGIRLERGESDDYYLGGVFVNIMISETIFGVMLTLLLVAMWPNVRWDALEYTMIVAMITAPIALYPISRLIWLAADLLVRPPDPEEMAWHASTSDPPD